MTGVYLDNNATTEPSPAVREAVFAALGPDGFGNASSPTPHGQRARSYIEHARDSVGRLVGSDPMQVLFTSGCTEGNNIVLRLALKGPRRLITTETEHASVGEVASWLETLGVEVVRLRGLDGRIDPDDLATALETPAALVSIQWANSETGVLQPVAELAEVCRIAGVPLHVDAAQAVGREEIGFDALGLDYLTFSGHKLHAPQGVGALIARDPGTLPRLLRGGDQEQGQRAGTENLPGISGLSAACAERADGLAAAAAQMRGLRERFETALLWSVPSAKVNAASSPRVCNTSNVRFPVDGQALMAQLTAAGVICSQTSACSSRAPEPSKVLTAIGLSRDEAYSSVRFSFSVMNTDHDVDVAVDAAASACRRLAELETI
jgi:cysteine desulfurase